MRLNLRKFNLSLAESHIIKDLSIRTNLIADKAQITTQKLQLDNSELQASGPFDCETETKRALVRPS